MADSKAIVIALSAVAAVGAILGLVSIVLDWIVFYGYGFTGWDFIDGALDHLNGFDKDTYVAYLPMVVPIFAVIGLLGAVVSFLKRGKSGAAMMVVSGLAILVATIMFMTYSYTIPFFNETISFMDYVDVGTYLAVVSGALLTVGGIGVAIKN